MPYRLDIELSGSIGQRVARIKESLPSGRKRIPPHITVLNYFKYEEERRLLEKLENWTASQTPFRVCLGQVESIRSKKFGVVYVGLPEGDEEKIVRLRQECAENLGAPILAKTPHLTLSQRITPGTVNEIADMAREVWTQTEIPIEGLVLSRKDLGQRNWQRYAFFGFAELPVVRFQPTRESVREACLSN